ncbi:UNVERIFIED_CONTAM: hypothetical protein FKN15_073011 [Acipenser sinensis]
MAADPGTPAPGQSAVAGESGGGPGYSSTMLDDFRRIVRKVIRDEIAMLRSEIQSAIAPIKAALSECFEKVREVEGSMNVFDARLAGVESACNLLASENNKLLAKIDDLENRMSEPHRRSVVYKMDEASLTVHNELLNENLTLSWLSDHCYQELGSSNQASESSSRDPTFPPHRVATSRLRSLDTFRGE